MMKRFLLLLLIFPFGIKAVTMEEYRNAVAGVAESAATTYSDEWVYSYFWGGSPSNPIDKSDEIRDRRNQANKGQKTASGYIYGINPRYAGIQGSFTNKFSVYCETFIQVMVHHASNGAVGYPGDYEQISLSEMQRGDMIHFHNHIAIYLGPGEGNTYRVAHANGKILVENETRTPDHAYRLKESALAKLDYNYVTASYDFHDRLDDYAPIIRSVTLTPNSNKITIVADDYKHYDLTPPSDIIEPENNGIVGYQITTSNVKPTTFKTVKKTQNLDVVDEVSKNGTYYIWVKDVGGNVSSYTVTLTNVVTDTTKPKVGSLSSTSYENSILILVLGASDESGIKEFRYYLDNDLVATTKENQYLFDDLIPGEDYNIYYEVVDNNNNVSKSTNYKLRAGVDAKSITIQAKQITLTLGETYVLQPIVNTEGQSYTIKYSSSDSKVASVSNKGTIKAISPGDAVITISVGRTSEIMGVHVSKYDVKFLTSSLRNAYVGENYEQPIKTNIPTTITLYSGILPSGLYISNNSIKGKPTSEALGKYNFTLVANIEGETFVKEFSLNVYKKSSSFNYVLLLIPIIIAAAAFGYYKFKKKKIVD